MTESAVSPPQSWVPAHTDARPVAPTQGVPHLAGFAHPDFSAVVDEFIHNFSRGEIGASFCLTVEGQRVVDVWGGYADATSERRWKADTLAVFFSCSKMPTALVIHHLLEQGLLELDRPLSDYWPELIAGQQGGTLRMALAHTLGLPALSMRLRKGAYDDHDYMAAQLAAQQPWWEPGTRVGYHPITFGFVLGELVRRVTGQSLGAYLRQWLTDALGLDLWIGLPESAFPRVAPIVPHQPSRSDPITHVAALSRAIGSIPNLWLFNAGGWTVESINSASGLVSEIPAATGVGNARALAGMLSIFGQPDTLSALGLGGETLSRLEHVSSATHRDATLQTRTRFSLGFMKSMDNREDLAADNFIVGESAYGHVGHGGSFGFFDPTEKMAAAYVMNQQGPGILLNTRGQALIDACYRVQGFRGITGGAWRP